jgi:hypothetical protein
MTFFTPTSLFTHYGSLFGIPVYLKNPDSDCPIVAGTNAIFDWMLLWWPQSVTFCYQLMVPWGEPHFRIEIKGELQ